MKNDQIHDRIFDSLERIEEKLDNHVQRIVAIEEKTKANQGTIKVIVSGMIALATSAVTWIVKTLMGNNG